MAHLRPAPAPRGSRLPEHSAFVERLRSQITTGAFGLMPTRILSAAATNVAPQPRWTSLGSAPYSHPAEPEKHASLPCRTSHLGCGRPISERAVNSHEGALRCRAPGAGQPDVSQPARSFRSSHPCARWPALCVGPHGRQWAGSPAERRRGEPIEWERLIAGLVALRCCPNCSLSLPRSSFSPALCLDEGHGCPRSPTRGAVSSTGPDGS